MRVLYVIRESLAGFRRAKLAATGSIITIAISLLFLGLFFLISTNTAKIVDAIRERVEMEAFLQEPMDEKRVSDIERQILNIRGVDHVRFISKEEAAAIFKQEFGEDVKGVLEFNPLPPSFKIFLQETHRTSTQADEISKSLRGIPGVDGVIYRREMLEFIEKQTKVLNLAGLSLGVFIGISAIFLVSNTIRLTIHARRRSVQTMKLVGASRWFVRAPFVIEGILQGVIGGGIAAGVIYFLLSFAAGIISADLAAFIRIDPLFHLMVVASGALLGLFGSAISVRRFIGEGVAG
ncbi:MAG TPA: permease-like cell division protein FtsX [Bacteroidota bacterium]|nr:permease-like cell division protein FtsX [Bacteroidota bacterium]